jgi:hypothetical protein
MSQIRAAFGFEEERLFPITFGQNKKGGMDSKEFKKYVPKSIVPLKTARDKPGHCVMLKVDRGPGRMNLNLLARLRQLGFVMYPGMPNTTHVSQETDQQYGDFKTQFTINLDTIVEGRINNGVSLSLQPKLMGLPLFGGVDSETGVCVTCSAFKAGFFKAKCLCTWEKVGAATVNGVTCACLLDQQVLMQVGDNDDIDAVYCIVQEANDNAIHAMSWAGYDAQFLQATYKPKAKEDVAIREPNLREQQLALMNAKGHGGVYHVTKGGRNITANDFFVAAEMKSRKAERVEVQKRKKEAQKMEALEVKALATLQNMEGKTTNELHVDNLNALLGWHEVAIGMLKNKGEKVA